MSDYWSNRVVFGKVADLELASLTFEAVADFSKALPAAFKLLPPALSVYSLAIRQLTPIADGPLALSLATPTGQVFGDLTGSIQSWRGIDRNGKILAAGALTGPMPRRLQSPLSATRASRCRPQPSLLLSRIWGG